MEVKAAFGATFRLISSLDFYTVAMTNASQSFCNHDYWYRLCLFLFVREPHVREALVKASALQIHHRVALSVYAIDPVQ